MKKFFTKQEFVAVCIILTVIAVISFFNFQIALRRGRDNERINDLSDIAKMLNDYKETSTGYPPDLSYLKRAPKDPGTKNGYSYLYFTNGKFFQLYASLEGKTDESQYNEAVQKLNFMCGNFVCNFGRSSGNIPLDKSIEEYENELKAK